MTKIYKDPTYTENLRRSRRMTEFNDADEDGRDRHRNRIMNAALKRKRKKEHRAKNAQTISTNSEEASREIISST